MPEYCLFCQIIKRAVPSSIVYETEAVLAFSDINPKAKVHILITPKEHIASLACQGAESAAYLLVKAAKEIAKKEHLSGYKLVFNVGQSAGQTIDHLHLHLLSGKLLGNV